MLPRVSMGSADQPGGWLGGNKFVMLVVRAHAD